MTRGSTFTRWVLTRHEWIVWGVLASCSTQAPSAGPPAQGGKLPAGIVAKVGPLVIEADSVRRVARAQHIQIKIALDYEIRDALFATAALDDHLDDIPSVRAALRARLGRIPLERLRDEVDATDPTEREVADATSRHFVDLDRPETFRVVHALVKLPDHADASTASRARGVAERLAEQLLQATDERDFRARAAAFTERGGFEIVVETLKPVTVDGRVADLDHPSAEPESYVTPFATEAARLRTQGQKSGIVASEFGFHTLMLLERLPEKRVGFDERRRLLREEILRERAKGLKTELIEGLRAATPPTIERNADTLLTSIGKDHDAL